jgi:hypothetical protein
MKIIKEEYSKGTQSAHYIKMMESDEGSKIKIDIKSDSYDFQSHAKVYAFSPTELKWNVISSIAFSEMKTPAKLYYQIGYNQAPDVVAPHFIQDTQELTKQAEDILGQSFSPAAVKKVTRKPK